MTKILLLEDIIIQLEKLSLILTEAGYEIAGTARSGEKALQVFRQAAPDLAILDIKVMGEMDGVEVGKIMQSERPIPVIFLTAYEEEYERAKISHPAAFLSKPYNERNLLHAIDLALFNFFEKNEGLEKNAEPSAKLSNVYFSSDCIWVKPGAGQAFCKLPLDDLLWMEADNVYLDIHVKSAEKPFSLSLPLAKFIASIRQMTGGYERIIQVNRSALVNFDHVTQFSPEKIGLRNGVEVRVGDKFREEVSRLLR